MSLPSEGWVFTGKRGSAIHDLLYGFTALKQAISITSNAAARCDLPLSTLSNINLYICPNPSCSCHPRYNVSSHVALARRTPPKLSKIITDGVDAMYLSYFVMLTLRQGTLCNSSTGPWLYIPLPALLKVSAMSRSMQDGLVSVMLGSTRKMRAGETA